jgi:hypothetical protein
MKHAEVTTEDHKNVVTETQNVMVEGEKVVCMEEMGNRRIGKKLYEECDINAKGRVNGKEGH